MSRSLTLVELLVVIAIVGLLLAIWFPSLARARFAAVDAQCGANLRSVDQAVHGFANENRDCPAPTVRDHDFYWDRDPRIGWDIQTGLSLGIAGGPGSTWRCPLQETAYVGNSRALGLDASDLFSGRSHLPRPADPVV